MGKRTLENKKTLVSFAEDRLGFDEKDRYVDFVFLSDDHRKV